jgi:hypothetical protein
MALGHVFGNGPENVISNANSSESRPGASAPASQAEQSRRPAKSTGTIDTTE